MFESVHNHDKIQIQHRSYTKEKEKGQGKKENGSE